VFEHCYFQKSSLSGSTLENCTFEECEIDGFECDTTTNIRNVILQKCGIVSFSPTAESLSEYVPERIVTAMRQRGFIVEQAAPEAPVKTAPVEPDQKVQVMERVLRAFIRSTGVNENTLRRRLGPQAFMFFDEMLPDLMNRGVFEEVQFRGAGNQRRFRIKSSFDRVAGAIEACGGNYDRFIELVTV
jgi:hypothetical protein